MWGGEWGTTKEDKGLLGNSSTELVSPTEGGLVVEYSFDWYSCREKGEKLGGGYEAEGDGDFRVTRGDNGGGGDANWGCDWGDSGSLRKGGD